MTTPRIRVLATAFAAVPGSSPHGASLLSMVDALRAEMDLVTLKTEDLSHIKRIGDARMFRVPVGTGPVGEQRDIFARAVARQLEAEDYQVVHVLDPWSGQIAAERADRGFSLVYEVATLPSSEGDELETWLPAHRLTLSRATRILVSTNASARALEARGFSGRIEVVRPGVDVGAYDHLEMPPLGVPRLLYLGELTPDRDLLTVLDALARVSEHRPVRALFAGERRRERRAAFRKEVEKRRLSAGVDVRGEPNPRAIPGLIAASDVCLAPAANQSVDGVVMLPQPLLEYAACLRPVVAAHVPGVPEVIRDDVEGLLYPPGDAGALADAILEVLRDSVLRERVTQAGYQRTREELSAGARRRRIRRVYEDLVPGSQAEDPWEANFEATGLIELSTSALEALQEQVEPEREAASVPPPPPPPGNVTLAQPSVLDTQPGLRLPDTDPGRS